MGQFPLLASVHLPTDYLSVVAIVVVVVVVVVSILHPS